MGQEGHRLGKKHLQFFPVSPVVLKFQIKFCLEIKRACHLHKRTDGSRQLWLGARLGHAPSLDPEDLGQSCPTDPGVSQAVGPWALTCPAGLSSFLSDRP